MVLDLERWATEDMEKRGSKVIGNGGMMGRRERGERKAVYYAQTTVSSSLCRNKMKEDYRD